MVRLQPSLALYFPAPIAKPPKSIMYRKQYIVIRISANQENIILLTVHMMPNASFFGLQEGFPMKDFRTNFTMVSI